MGEVGLDNPTFLFTFVLMSHIGAGKNLQKMTNYTPEVMEVHNEFMTAGDTLLKKAEEILKAEVKINPAKIERLKSFGFKSSKDNTALEDDKKEKTRQQKIVEAINYYRLNFPNYKFIPTDTVKAICEKYGLVSGEAHQYKGFVPDKNLSEIEQFFEAHPDMKFTYWRNPTSGDGLIAYVQGDIKITKQEYDELNAKQERKEEVTTMQEVTKKAVQSFKKGMDMDIPTTNFFNNASFQSLNNWGETDLARQLTQASIQTYRSGIDPYVMDDYGIQIMKPRQTGRSNYEAHERELSNMYKMFMPSYTGVLKDQKCTTSKKETTLRICAPMSEMNTSGYTLREGYRLVYDPIVSIEVTHKNGIKGEIILTAWGDEASDPLVIDQNKN